MRIHMFLYAPALLLVALGAQLAASIDKERALARITSPVLVNFELSETSVTSCVPFSSGLIDFTEPYQLEGSISNTTLRGHEIDGIDVWFALDDGTRLPSSGASPVATLDIQSGTTWKSCLSMSQANGVHTFHFPEHEKIAPNDYKHYRIHVSSFREVHDYNVCASFSTSKASQHFAILESALCHHEDHGNGTTVFVDGNSPISRDAVVLGIANGDQALKLKKVTVTMVTNQRTLQAKSAVPLDTSGKAIPGVSVSIAADGRTLSVSDLSIKTGVAVNLWIELNESYSEETAFKVKSVY